MIINEIVRERDALEGRRAELNLLIGSVEFKSLSKEHQSAIRLQSRSMDLYILALNQRIGLMTRPNYATGYHGPRRTYRTIN